MPSNPASAAGKLIQLVLLMLLASPAAGALVVVDGGETELNKGDRITGLVQDENRVELADPLQLYLAAIRQGASADVVFYGSRGTSDRQWAVPSSRWDFTVAPELADKNLEAKLVRWLAADGVGDDAGLLTPLTGAWTAQGKWHDLAWLFINLARK